jgi:hypothetical protein
MVMMFRCFHAGGEGSEATLECGRIVGDTAILLGELRERAMEPKAG